MIYSKNGYIKNRFSLEKKDIDSLHSLRYKVFHKKMGWKVPTLGELEIDSYDALNPVYIVHKEHDKVVGCMRLLPTLGFYMLRNTFPQMLRGEDVPQSPKILEISRFAVDEKFLAGKGNFASNITYSLLRGIYFYAQKMNVEQYVLVTTVAIERYLRRMGIQTTRFGDGKTTSIGKDVCVALKINIDESFRNSIMNS